MRRVRQYYRMKRQYSILMKSQGAARQPDVPGSIPMFVLRPLCHKFTKFLIELIESNISKFKSWFSSNYLVLNPYKTKTINFSCKPATFN